MIGTRTPFRISLVGGGSDVKSFYSERPGCVVSTTIDKYMYIFVHSFFDNRIQVKYSRTELRDSVEKIEHPIVRVLLHQFKIKGIDINSIADIPAGTGLGSSGSFTVGLIHSLYGYMNKYVSKETLAKKACEIEIEILKEPIGKQDQYAAAYGGLNYIQFLPNGEVKVEPIIMPHNKFKELRNNLLLFYMGGSHSAGKILSTQQKNTKSHQGKFNSLVQMAELATCLKENLSKGDISATGEILDENWRLKKCLSSEISNAKIDYYYNCAKHAGALGGKLLGAGKGGFLLFYCEKNTQQKLRQSLKELREIPFNFEFSGTKMIYYEGV